MCVVEGDGRQQSLKNRRQGCWPELIWYARASLTAPICLKGMPACLDRDALSQERSNRLKTCCIVLDIIFPEFVSLFSDITGKTARELLNVAPTPLRYKLDLLDLLKTQLQEIETQMNKHLQLIPQAGYMCSIPGLGPISVASILGETGPIQAYEAPEQLIKLAGLNLFEISSGYKKGKRRITKRGRARLRRILYTATLPLIFHNPIFKVAHRLPLLPCPVNSASSLHWSSRNFQHQWQHQKETNGFSSKKSCLSSWDEQDRTKLYIRA